MLRGLWLVVALLGAACGSDEGTGAPDQCPPSGDPAPVVCEAGKVTACPCVGTTDPGTQACADDGSKWLECACPSPGSIPMQECTSVMDQADLIASDRCATGQIMYRECTRSIVERGICTSKSFGAYCCPKP